jgi:hypothetical protein
VVKVLPLPVLPVPAETALPISMVYLVVYTALEG